MLIFTNYSTCGQYLEGGEEAGSYSWIGVYVSMILFLLKEKIKELHEKKSFRLTLLDKTYMHLTY